MTRGLEFGKWTENRLLLQPDITNGVMTYIYMDKRLCKTFVDKSRSFPLVLWRREGLMSWQIDPDSVRTTSETVT